MISIQTLIYNQGQSMYIGYINTGRCNIEIRERNGRVYDERGGERT